MPQFRLVMTKTEDVSTTPPTKATLVSEFEKWDDGGRTTPPTARLLLGQFYQRHKARYRLFPPSDVMVDLANIGTFLTQYMADDPTLAPWVIDYFSQLKQFSGFTTFTLINQNILSKWSAFERAERLRCRFGVGEQAEFRTEGGGFGTVYV